MKTYTTDQIEKALKAVLSIPVNGVRLLDDNDVQEAANELILELYKQENKGWL